MRATALLPLVCTGLIAAAPSAYPAPISWDPPLDMAAATDIDSTGFLVEAKNATSGGDSPTVDTGTEAIPFQAMDFGVNATGTGTFFTGDGSDTGNAELNTVFNSHVWSPSAWSFALSGLSAGTTYQIQVIAAGDTRDCCGSRNQRAGDAESPANLSGDFSRSGVGSVVGRFTADGTTQAIQILPGSVGGTDPGISGYILRETSPPDSQPPTGLHLSNTELPPDLPPGSTVGTLSTTDPNPDDTHTYSLVGSAGFPDNNLFAIASGNVLQTTTALGGFGSTYEIKLRTTDGGGLFFEQVVTLQVEAAQPPSALDFSTNTVLRTTPTGGAVGIFSTVDANGADSHSYALVPGQGDSNNGHFQIAADTLEVAGPLPGLGSLLSIRVRSTDLAGLHIEAPFSLTVVDSSVRINEFLADNTSTTLADEDGDRPDWIELHNPGSGSVDLTGWFLTDNPSIPTKWQFPSTSLPGGGYLVVFASNKDRRPGDGGTLHTNFALSAGGEYLALVAADGITVVSEFAASGAEFPPQKAGVSYGFFGDPLQIGFMKSPTPNAPNDASSGILGFVEDTKFSVDRGIYEAPIALEITSATPGATIRYTTNGSWPSESSGTIYNGPLAIDRTTPVKAIAYKTGFEPTNVDTHTYLFLDSVLAQTEANTQSIYGLPDFSEKYYGMNNNPAVNPSTHPTIADDLTTVPSLSIAIDANDMFGSSAGIYTHPGSSGTAWERRTSLELIDPTDPGGPGNFQLNCAIRIQGGAFRSFGLTRKKSFRVLFKSQYGSGGLPTGGPGKLDFPLFGEGSGVAQEFQTLIFRMESNDGWQWSAAGGQPQYARDEFGRRVQLALGQPASHGRYLHLYINGVYWGLYNVVERPDSGFAESYIDGAVRELWEGQNSGSPTNDATSLTFWNTYKSELAPISTASTGPARDAIFLRASGFDPDGTRNPAFPVWADPDNNIDYFLTNWYVGNSDWPHKNYYGGIDSQPGRDGYKYFMWDAEWSLFLRSDTNTNRVTDFRGIAEPQDDLEESPEYRMRFADRAHRALFHGGPLSPEGARSIYEEITARHTSILVPEAARWGNQHGQARHVGHWQAEYDHIIADWFPVRSGIFLSQLRARGLYPDIAAPVYSQHGGTTPVGSGPSLVVPTSVGQVYYQFGLANSDPDEFRHPLDPRLVGGGIDPAATLVSLGGGGGPTTTRFIQTGDTWRYLDDGSDQGTAWRAPAFDHSAWSSGPSQLGYGDSDEATVVGFIDSDPGSPGIQKNATTYFRRTVTIAAPGTFQDFTVDYLFDDGIAIYVNGLEVVRRNLGTNAAYNSFATGSSGDNATGTITLPSSAFVAGTNTVAAEVHQDSPGSSDMSFDLGLTGNPPGGGDTHASPPIALDGPGWLFSRSYDPATGEWSALNTAFFTTGSEPAGQGNLVVSEFHYHPSAPATAGETAASTDPNDFEFIELMNISAQPLDLTGVSFTDGITYAFPENTILAAGERTVLARDAGAFAARYGFQPAGLYSGRLDNDGERLRLVSSATGPIQDFTYNDQLPWPVIADGGGPSLVLISPAQPAPDHGTAANWAPSATPHGTPGTATPIGFTGDPDLDQDGDSLSAFMEFALGTSDSDPSDLAAAFTAGVAQFAVGANTGDYLVLTARKNLFAHNVVKFQAEVSADARSWEGGSAVVPVSETENGDGTATVVWRSAAPITPGAQQFIRLRLTQE
ncbi:hypothetical protein BH23VER1_BH23VER1_02640 [soil metagenome]